MSSYCESEAFIEMDQSKEDLRPKIGNEQKKTRSAYKNTAIDGAGESFVSAEDTPPQDEPIPEPRNISPDEKQPPPKSKKTFNDLFSGICLLKYRKKIINTGVLLISIVSISIAIYAVIQSNKKENIVVEIKNRTSSKSVMLYKPMEKYLIDKDRGKTVKWLLVKEDSRKPFRQLNDTHILFGKEGFFQISSSLQMWIFENKFIVITLIVNFNREYVYFKESHSSNRTILSLQLQSIVRHFKLGNTISIEVDPPSYFVPDRNMSYLSIVEL